jgi:3-isopropylmalate dehydrogenase
MTRRTDDTSALIAVLPGDGIGPEVVDRARHSGRRRRALRQALRTESALVGGDGHDATGDPSRRRPWPLARRADAVLLGAVGGPKWDDPGADRTPEGGILTCARVLGLFANLRR